MFRTNQSSEMKKDKCGVGTVMIIGSDKYLICSLMDKNVFLLDLITFVSVQKSSIKVEDINFLTEDEVRQLGYSLNCTLSDFDFDNIGLKEYNRKLM